MATFDGAPHSSASCIDELGNPVPAPHRPVRGESTGIQADAGHAWPAHAAIGEAVPEPGSAFTSIWRAGTIVGVVQVLLGIVMLAVFDGLAAVVFWPLGTMMAVMGVALIWVTHRSWRAARRAQWVAVRV